ncbi:MAG: multinuclear nonheme iron-dependent oxidase, partial [Gallionella sp.]
EKLGRQLLIENLSSYVSFAQSQMSEGEFLAELVQKTGCGVLFDVENLYVNSQNLGVDAAAFIRTIPAHAVQEYHLAGFSNHEGCLVDTHDHPVSDAVWDLYQTALQHIGLRPTLIEWDSSIPELCVLQNEAQKAQRLMEQNHARRA